MSRLELSTTNVIIISEYSKPNCVHFQYECPCGKKLSTSQALGSHRRTCTGLTNTGLTNTGLTSTGLTSTGLTSTNHSVVQSNANTTDDSLLCCGRTFANKSALTSHKRSKRHKVKELEPIKKYIILFLFLRKMLRILLREPIPRKDQILLRRSPLSLEEELLLLFFNLRLDALHAAL